jgi:hypothetical protein
VKSLGIGVQENLTYKDIKIESPFEIHTLTGLSIKNAVNDHGKAVVTGVLEEGVGDDIVTACGLQDTLKIILNDEPVFSGVITDVVRHHRNRVKHIEIEAFTHSFLLDIRRISRSFQNKANTYENIFKQITREEHKGDYKDTLTKGCAQERTIIQYNETDWDFIKRLASHKYGIISAELNSDAPKIWIGLADGDNYIEPEGVYTIDGSLVDYAYYHYNVSSQNQLNFVSYMVESKNIYFIGDRIVYNDVEFMVCETEIKLKDDLVVCFSKIQKPEGIVQNIRYNPFLKGMSLDGKILNVKDDTIRLHLDIDKEQKESEANWYRFNTHYTSAGSTGYYVMPQIGDYAKLYIPDEEEDHAYVRSINRIDGDTNPLTSSPDSKYLGTVNNKQIKMDGSELKITAKDEKDGKMFMTMNKDAGITLDSDKKIDIYTEQDITFMADTVYVQSQTEIKKNVDMSSALLKTETKFHSPKITMRGGNSGNTPFELPKEGQ